MRRTTLWLGLASILLTGCQRGAAMPYLGKWSGGFEVNRVRPGAAIQDPKRNNLKGFLQLYATESRYELHLDGEQFGLVARGSWSEEKGRLSLTPNSVKIDDGGGEEARNPNRAWIDAKDLSEAYSRPMGLRLSKDGQRLTGLLIDVGPLTGTHSFVREGFGR